MIIRNGVTSSQRIESHQGEPTYRFFPEPKLTPLDPIGAAGVSGGLNSVSRHRHGLPPLSAILECCRENMINKNQLPNGNKSPGICLLKTGIGLYGRSSSNNRGVL